MGRAARAEAVSRALGRTVAAALVAAAAAGAFADVAAQGVVRLLVAVDKSHVLDVKEPATKVAVANPAIADVQVITPNQLVVSGKAVGTTSLLVLSPRSIQHFELVIHPGPAGAARVPTPVRDVHPVLVQRADRLSEHLFVRDVDQLWVELGSVKLETEPGKK